MRHVKLYVVLNYILKTALTFIDSMIDWLIQLSIEEKINLILAIGATVAMLINWRSFRPNLRVLTLYPLVHFAEKFFSVYPYESSFQKGSDVYVSSKEYGYSGIVSEIKWSLSLTPVSYGILAVFFYLIIKKKRIRVLASIPLFWVLDNIGVPKFAWELESTIINNSVGNVTEGAFIILWCFYYFRDTLYRNEEYYPENDSTFWVTVGLLFYFIGTFFIVGLLKYIFPKENIFVANASYIGYMLNYLFFGLLIVLCLIKLPIKSYE